MLFNKVIKASRPLSHTTREHIRFPVTEFLQQLLGFHSCQWNRTVKCRTFCKLSNYLQHLSSAVLFNMDSNFWAAVLSVSSITLVVFLFYFFFFMGFGHKERARYLVRSRLESELHGMVMHTRCGIKMARLPLWKMMRAPCGLLKDLCRDKIPPPLCA